MTTQCENQTCESQNCESQNSIDPFEQAEIQKLIDSETFINVFLGNGVKLVGTPKEQSDHAILLSQKTDELMLLKNAISSITIPKKYEKSENAEKAEKAES